MMVKNIFFYFFLKKIFIKFKKGDWKQNFAFGKGKFFHTDGLNTIKKILIINIFLI